MECVNTEPWELGVLRVLQREESPHSLYVHCSNYSLDLILPDVAREVNLIAEGLYFVQGVAVLVKASTKHKRLIVWL